MDLHQGGYYHLYNRSNQGWKLFRQEENYYYFLHNFRDRFADLIAVLAYCLMPTHFHFVIKVETEDIDDLKRLIGIQLSAYTKAYNKMFNSHGSLFQNHTKTKLIGDRSYLLNLLTYVHQNPVRAGLVKDLNDWPYSSYLDLAGLRNDEFVDISIVKQAFGSTADFIEFSQRTLSDFP